LAAEFVKSVETGDTLVNFELRELANMIESVAMRLDLSNEEPEVARMTVRRNPLDAA
jgi:hypothetical protein